MFASPMRLGESCRGLIDGCEPLHACVADRFRCNTSGVAKRRATWHSLEWPNQFVLMYHGVICLYNRANYERFAFATTVRPALCPGARFTSFSSVPLPPPPQLPL